MAAEAPVSWVLGRSSMFMKGDSRRYQLIVVRLCSHHENAGQVMSQSYTRFLRPSEMDVWHGEHEDGTAA